MLTTGSVADLSAEGSVDWVHWGLNSEFGWNRKANVAPAIGPLVPIIAPSGSGPYRYSDNLTGFNWSDGTPTLITTNTTTGVWDISKGSGFQLTVPADTTLRRLRVYVGAFEAQGEFTASLSDGSAAVYSNTAIDIAANAPGGVYTITYAANSVGQTLTVSFIVQKEHDNKVGNVTWQAATLALATGNNPPTTSITNPVANMVFTAGSDIPLSALASDSDGTVTNLQFLQGNTLLGPVTAAPWALTWTNVSAGFYSLRSVATDNGGLSYTSAPVEIFVCANSSLISGSLAMVPVSVDLDASGPQDWMHWGYSGAETSDRRADGSGVIGFTSVGANPLEQVLDYPTLFNWANGTPNGTAYTQSGIRVAGLTNGFYLTVPAMTYTQTLTVYVGLYASRGNLQAWLNDCSAPAYTDGTVQSFYNNDYGAYTLSFASVSPNRFLNVRYTSSAQYDMTYGGNVSLAAATLVGLAPAPPQQVPLLGPVLNGSHCTFSFWAAANRAYAVERTDSLNPTDWQPFTNFLGTGTTVLITDSPLTAGSRFYRVSTY